MNPARIAFVGTGRMGANMARRLKDRGHSITAVYDPATAAADALARELGATRATSLAAVTAAADVIFTVVPDDAAQLAVFAEQGDSLLTGAAGRIFVNCATLTPAVHLEVERRARAAGAGSLEACMASSIPQARAGTLYLMCGGDEAVFARVRPILGDLSSALRHLGPTGRAAQVRAATSSARKTSASDARCRRRCKAIESTAVLGEPALSVAAARANHSLCAASAPTAATMSAASW